MTSATNPSPRTPTGSMVWICGRCCRWILCRSWGIPPPCALVALQGGAGVVFGAQKKDVLKILEESPILWMVYYGLPQNILFFFLNHFHGVKPTLINFVPKFPPPSPCHWGGKNPSIQSQWPRRLRFQLYQKWTHLRFFQTILIFGHQKSPDSVLWIYWIYWFRLVWSILSQTLEPKCWRFLRCWGVCQPSFP